MRRFSNLYFGIIPILFIFILNQNLTAQQEVYSKYYYRIYLVDKGGTDQLPLIPDEVLSQRAMQRRNKNGITVDLYDTPLHKPYVDSLKSIGLEVHCGSKWLNTVTVASTGELDIENMKSISFIDSILLVRPPIISKSPARSYKLNIEEYKELSPPYYWQLQLSNGDYLHNLGAKGANILIAVLDGGYTRADIVESLSPIHLENRVVFTYDFVQKNEFVYDYSSHGTAVFSILAGNIPGELTGSAPNASYLLLRTEDTSTEYLIEEDLWVAAAEFADSSGADIITSSLGYSTFDDPSMNYNWDQLDGNTTYVSKGAEIAYSRGIIVVNSAGNSRDDPWLYVTSPADAEHVISAGAVDGDANISIFSSAGPTADGRIKPDVVAMGVGVSYQTTAGVIKTGNGTSFACPITSGLIACLMQSFPEASAKDIRDAIIIGADRYNSPDTIYGYGLANFRNSFLYLNERLDTQEELLKFYPNPTTGRLYIRTNKVIDKLDIKVYSINGTLIYDSTFINTTGPVTTLSEFENLPAGIYIVWAGSEGNSWQQKIIKLKQ